MEKVRKVGSAAHGGGSVRHVDVVWHVLCGMFDRVKVREP